MIGKIIFYLVFAIVTQFLTYKFMKKIDKREREKLKKWEDDYIDELIEHRKQLLEMVKLFLPQPHIVEIYSLLCATLSMI